MFNLFKKDTPSVGSILYRGNLHGRPEEFSFLEKSSVRLRPGKESANAHWALKLEHPEWGSADLVALRDVPPPPATLYEYSFSLSPAEKAEASSAGHVLTLTCPATRREVLRDRKSFMRFARAVMADDGLALLDHVSQVFWSRAALDEELVHDADLDIEAVYCMHAVTKDEDREHVDWLHSHGLAELGAFDFDILAPAPDLMAGASDGLRAIAFAIVEGSVQRSTARFQLAYPGGEVRFVPVEEFNRKAPAGQRALRDAEDEAHNPPKGPPRAVLADPVGVVRGLMGADVRMSRFLSRPISENTVFHFSHAATELMAERARNTVSLFERLSEEFADLGLPRLMKIGYPVDGGTPEEREHLWFEVHGVDVRAEKIDATLVNQPHRVARMRPGARGEHPLELLSDWAIMSPAGQITPRSLRAARLIREHRPQIAELIRQAREEEAAGS